jgi:hypothetical protein
MLVALTALAERNSKNDATVLPKEAQHVYAGGDEACAWRRPERACRTDEAKAITMRETRVYP